MPVLMKHLHTFYGVRRGDHYNTFTKRLPVVDTL
uniref:Uncharacterized protein n=1 Tax=Arundo donax TaxID=35708 RepID=A0A0A9BE81_ARUDO